MIQQSVQNKTIVQTMCIFACLMVVVSLTGCGTTIPTPTSNEAAASGQTPVPSNTTTTPATIAPTTPVEKKTVYKNGTYSADGEYRSPAGAESITVSLTLVNDVITDATVTPHATNKRSIQMQDAFISGFKQLVVGKNIDEVTLDKVSGSSLTPKGFNDAIAKIKVQAKA